MDDVVSALIQFEPHLADVLRSSIIEHYLTGASRIASKALRTISAVAPPDVPFGPLIAAAPSEEPMYRLPQIEEAARSLRSRRVMTPSQFAVIDQDARRTAFTVARTQSIATIERVRDVLVRDVETGGTLREFRRNLDGALDGILTGPQVESLYRTQVAQAYSAGQQAIIRHPMVADEFPYLLWVATHDTRTRADHLAMERHGQNGTAVYRADDPMWRTHYPPAGWNCRCAVIPLSIADAARHGSREAQQWLNSGMAPLHREFARHPYPLKLPPHWPSSSQIASVA